MSYVGSLIVIAAGAILRYAVNDEVKDIDLATVGLILMIAGAAALVLSLVYSAAWMSRRRAYDDRHGEPPPA